MRIVGIEKMGATERVKVQERIINAVETVRRARQQILKLARIFVVLGDSGVSNSFNHYADMLDDLLEVDDGEAGLIPFTGKVFSALK